MHPGSWNTAGRVNPHSSPEPEFESTKFCEAVSDKSGSFFCPVQLSDGSPFRFCPQHQKEFVESTKRYKEASRRAEALRPRVLSICAKNRRGEMVDPREILEATAVVERCILWATEEDKERQSHRQRYYAFGTPELRSPKKGKAPSTAGHEKRIAVVKQLIQMAEELFTSASMIRMRASGPDEHERGHLEERDLSWQPTPPPSPPQVIALERSGTQPDSPSRVMSLGSSSSSQRSIRRRNSMSRLTARPWMRKTSSQTGVRSWKAYRR